MIHQPLVKNLLLVFAFILSSCSVNYDHFNGFELGKVYISKVDLFINSRSNRDQKLLSSLLEVDRNDSNKVLLKGNQIIIEEIYRIYPDSSGVTIVKGEVTTGKFKGQKILLSSNLDLSSFINIDN